MLNLDTLNVALAQKTVPKPLQVDLAELPEPGCWVPCDGGVPRCLPLCVSSPQVPLEDHVIYSGNLFQYIEENKKWRNRFCVVPHNYGLVLYENKLVRGITLLPIPGGHNSKGGHPVAVVAWLCSPSSMSVSFCAGL